MEVQPETTAMTAAIPTSFKLLKFIICVVRFYTSRSHWNFKPFAPQLFTNRIRKNKLVKAKTCDINDPNRAPSPETALGLYVHVPFCATTCNFCAFVQEKPNRTKIRDYLRSIDIEWSYHTRKLERCFDTVFWGGGTPGLLLPDDLRTLGSIFSEFVNPETLREWTVEMAPATVTPTKLEALKSMGVTRISMGVQTFNDETLKIMDRFHSVSQIHRAWDWIMAAGFENTNIDMIIAYPGQTHDQLLADLNQAVQLQPNHISTYCLTFEEDTPLYAKLMRGVYKIDRDAEADLYRSTWEFLESKEFSQYEISNFAKHGKQSIHNCNTWRMQEWIGVGPSASSQYDNRRWTNHPSPEKWASGFQGAQPVYVDECKLNPAILLTDSLLFGLRMNAGVDLRKLESRFHPLNVQRWQTLFNRLIEEGLALQQGDTFRLTLEGRLLADAIAVEILDLAD